jgi:hypothetical protein
MRERSGGREWRGEGGEGLVQRVVEHGRERERRVQNEKERGRRK